MKNDIREKLRNGKRIKSLAALLETAIDDSRKLAQRDDLYVPMSREWHAPIVDNGDNPHFGKCAVCLAGAMIAMTLKRTPKEIYSACRAPIFSRDALYALDSLRQGDFIGAYEELEHGLAEMAVLEHFQSQMQIPNDGTFKGFEEFDLVIDYLEEEVLPELIALEEQH